MQKVINRGISAHFGEPASRRFAIFQYNRQVKRCQAGENKPFLLENKRAGKTTAD
jgi:hypothetical protein